MSIKIKIEGITIGWINLSRIWDRLISPEIPLMLHFLKVLSLTT